jgi:hypothetical protein
VTNANPSKLAGDPTKSSYEFNKNSNRRTFTVKGKWGKRTKTREKRTEKGRKTNENP